MSPIDVGFVLCSREWCAGLVGGLAASRCKSAAQVNMSCAYSHKSSQNDVLAGGGWVCGGKITPCR